MENYDIKKALPLLYGPKRGDFAVVDVPELSFLMIDGHGDPNASPAYIAALQALYPLSYAVRAIAKSELGRVHTVGPLEGLWSATDPRAFASGDKAAWDWTMMISQPVWITAETSMWPGSRRSVKQAQRSPRSASSHSPRAPASRSCMSGRTTTKLLCSRGCTTSISRSMI